MRDSEQIYNSPITVLVREGTYYLGEPLEFGSADSGTAKTPITYAAYPGEHVTISGGLRLVCEWKPYQDGIMMAELPTTPSLGRTVNKIVKPVP